MKTLCNNNFLKSLIVCTICFYSYSAFTQQASIEPLNPKWIEYQSNKSNIEESTMPSRAT
ncbi:MAG: hypothetical protein PHF99_12860 [Bacteroidales bacterium]|nr:hypothetical protein [Bacteroidales bacterium]